MARGRETRRHPAPDLRRVFPLVESGLHCVFKASGAAVWWKKALYWAGAGIAGAVIGGLGMSLAGCGHNVDVTQGKTVICKDGSCLVLEPGHLSYSQAQPETAVPPVVQSLKK